MNAQHDLVPAPATHHHLQPTQYPMRHRTTRPSPVVIPPQPSRIVFGRPFVSLAISSGPLHSQPQTLFSEKRQAIQLQHGMQHHPCSDFVALCPSFAAGGGSKQPSGDEGRALGPDHSLPAESRTREFLASRARPRPHPVADHERAIRTSLRCRNCTAESTGRDGQAGSAALPNPRPGRPLNMEDLISVVNKLQDVSAGRLFTDAVCRADELPHRADFQHVRTGSG